MAIKDRIKALETKLKKVLDTEFIISLEPSETDPRIYILTIKTPDEIN